MFEKSQRFDLERDRLWQNASKTKVLKGAGELATQSEVGAACGERGAGECGVMEACCVLRSSSELRPLHSLCMTRSTMQCM